MARCPRPLQFPKPWRSRTNQRLAMKAKPNFEGLLLIKSRNWRYWHITFGERLVAPLVPGALLFRRSSYSCIGMPIPCSICCVYLRNSLLHSMRHRTAVCVRLGYPMGQWSHDNQFYNTLKRICEEDWSAAQSLWIQRNPVAEDRWETESGSLPSLLM